MNEKNAWDLIIENRFEEACQKADRDYRSEPARYSHMYNKVLALLNQKKYEDVIQLCLFLIEADNSESSADFIISGIAHWFLNQHEKAIEMWQRSKDTKYRDAAGGVQTPLMLHFAAIKLRDAKLEKEAFALLKKRAKSKMMINWPGPLANYMLNEIDEDTLLSKINSQPSLYARQSCQACFYMALKRLKNSDEAGYFDLLRRSVNFDPVSRLEPEYYLAKGELAKMECKSS